MDDLGHLPIILVKNAPENAEPIGKMVKRVWVYLRKSLLVLGQLMGRKPTRLFSHSRSLPRLSLALLSLCLLILAPLLASLGGVIWHEWKLAQNTRVLVPVHEQNWKKYWPAALAARDETSVAVTYADSTLFLTRLSEQELTHAFYLQANVLYLGPITGRFRVYLDGDLLSWGNSQGRTRPVMLSVPMKRLQQAEPLFVAIEISSDASATRPDRLGGAQGEGFVTPDAADQLIQSQQWQSELMPLVCATIFAVLGFLFFAGWLTQSEKQEYAYFAAFSFLQALGQFSAVDFAQQLLGAAFLSELRVVLLVWEGSLAMLLGLALARTRASWMAMAVSITVLATSVLLLAPWISLPVVTLARWEKYLFQVFVPLAYARGAIACLIQWNVLSHRRAFAGLGPAMSLRIIQRRRDLLRLGLGFLVVGALYATQAMFFSSTDPWMRVFRLSHFALLIACYGAGWMQDRLRDDSRQALRLTRHKNPTVKSESQDLQKAG